MARRKGWKKLSSKKRKKILSRPNYSGMSKKQAKKKYNKKAKKYNQGLKIQSNPQPSGLTRFGKDDPFGLKPANTAANRGPLKQPMGPFSTSPSGPSGTFGGQLTSKFPGVEGTRGFHPPMAGGPAYNVGKGGKKDPDPNSTRSILDEIVGDKEFGIKKGAEEFDWKKYLNEINQEKPEEQKLEFPGMPGIRTDISGGSASGIRRRRSKRSQLGLSSLGTNQLNRSPASRLALGGINY